MVVDLLFAHREDDFFSTTQIKIRIWKQNVSQKFTTFLEYYNNVKSKYKRAILLLNIKKNIEIKLITLILLRLS